MLPVLPLRKFASRVEALARTLEPSAEITCAYMCCEERYTHRRTASSSRSFRRERRARRRRITFLSLIFYALLLLGFFTTHDLIGVANTLALIGLGTTEITNFRGYLTDQLLVDAFDDDVSLARGFHGNRSEEHTSEL